MNDWIKEDDKFEWEDLNLLNKILFKIKPITFHRTDFNSNIINKLNNLFNKLLTKEVETDFFIKKESELYDNLILEVEKYNAKCKKEERISIYSFYDREKLLDIVKYKDKIFITGEGGVGKSYLLYKICRKLEIENKLFFISFGKFDNNFNINYEDVEEIINNNENETFYFIIDAINEYSKSGLAKIKIILEKIIGNENVKFILSYRDFTLQDNEMLFFQKNFRDVNYQLEGVNLEYALDNLISKYGVDVLKYESYINLQNPLYLKLLKNGLEDKKIINEEINSFSQITFLYESFIKKIDPTKKLWNITKEIVSKYMYNNDIKFISEGNLKKILKSNFEYYVSNMMQHGLLANSRYSNKTEYVLSFDFFNDYLIARWFAKDISNKNKEQVVQIINEKISNLFSINQSLIVALFDCFGNDYEKIWDIISNSDLIHYFDTEVVKLLRFKSRDDILKFQNFFEFDIEELIYTTFGINNKPFNSTEYFNKLFFDKKLLNILSNYKLYNYTKEYFLKRLRFNLALLSRLENNELIKNKEFYDEYFYFSFWLMSSSYKDVRMLACKCVFEFVRKNNNYSDFMIKNYPLIFDDYLKDSIVEIICYSENKILHKYKKFLMDIYTDKNELYSLKIIYIDNALFNSQRLYINEEKNNLLLSVQKQTITEDERNILFRIDIADKDLLPWKVYKEPWDECHLDLISEKKSIIIQLNKILREKYNCLKEDAKNCKLTKDKIFELENFKINETLVNKEKIVYLYLEILTTIAKKYKLNLLNFPDSGYYDFFSDSIYCKVVTIAMHILEGTLMCNYYTNEFNMHGYDIKKELGYIPYNRYEYDDSFELNYYHPISKFNEYSDILDEKLEKTIIQTSEKDDIWGKNQINIKSNLTKYIKPIKKGKSNWILLAADIRYIYPDGNHGHKWIDNYIINSSYNSKIKLTGNDDRYITIEWNKYKGAIEDYHNYKNDIGMIYKSVSGNSNYLPNNIMMLPPANLIKEFNLKYHSIDSTWRDENNTILIISNNNNKRFYKDVITKSLYINDSLFNKIKEKIKYYSFTSRSLKEGYIDESEFHYEFDSNGNELNFYRNSNQKNNHKEVFCLKCKYNQNESKEEQDKRKIEEQINYTKILEEIQKQIDEIIEN